MAIAIVIIMVNPLFAILSVPIIAIVIIDYMLFGKKKRNKKEKEIPIEEKNNVEEVRAIVEKIEKENEKEKEYRRNVDKRQFNGREDVTKEEVAYYIWMHYQWEGRKEKKMICEEISKVCNINEEDINWIMKEHYNHEGENGSWIRDEEEKRIIEYERKKYKENEKIYEEIKNKNKEMLKIFPELKEINEEIEKKEQENENYEYTVNYDEWLKKKGYI